MEKKPKGETQSSVGVCQVNFTCKKEFPVKSFASKLSSQNFRMLSNESVFWDLSDCNALNKGLEQEAFGGF